MCYSCCSTHECIFFPSWYFSIKESGKSYFFPSLSHSMPPKQSFLSFYSLIQFRNHSEIRVCHQFWGGMVCSVDKSGTSHQYKEAAYCIKGCILFVSMESYWGQYCRQAMYHSPPTNTCLLWSLGWPWTHDLECWWWLTKARIASWPPFNGELEEREGDEEIG